MSLDANKCHLSAKQKTRTSRERCDHLRSGNGNLTIKRKRKRKFRAKKPEEMDENKAKPMTTIPNCDVSHSAHYRCYCCCCNEMSSRQTFEVISNYLVDKSSVNLTRPIERADKLLVIAPEGLPPSRFIHEDAKLSQQQPQQQQQHQRLNQDAVMQTIGDNSNYNSNQDIEASHEQQALEQQQSAGLVANKRPPRETFGLIMAKVRAFFATQSNISNCRCDNKSPESSVASLQQVSPGQCYRCRLRVVPTTLRQVSTATMSMAPKSQSPLITELNCCDHNCCKSSSMLNKHTLTTTTTTEHDVGQLESDSSMSWHGSEFGRCRKLRDQAQSKSANQFIDNEWNAMINGLIAKIAIGTNDNKRKQPQSKVIHLIISIILTTILLLLPSIIMQPRFVASSSTLGSMQQTSIASDPRPTIYSGQVSFGLLLSAHSTLGGGSAELTTSASQLAATTALRQLDVVDKKGGDDDNIYGLPKSRSISFVEPASTTTTTTATTMATDDLNTSAATSSLGSALGGGVNATTTWRQSSPFAPRAKRQIFERNSRNYQVRRQQQQQQLQQVTLNNIKQQAFDTYTCSQVNPGALYAGMGAIWASHQANLVGDSQLTIGTYIYDSCNDLEVGQRQSVRIVSNLNAFQQTTCELPRGSPISLTIAHGDNQLRAIQLLTSFRVPVITTKEHFALEDYHQLNRDQKRFLFSTAPSSRHLALGALRFTQRVVARSTSAANLPNRYHKHSSKNGLIVISRNLPAKFITYLSETVPTQVKYEMLQTSQPIDQVKSIESLESILNRPVSSSSTDSSASSTTGESQLRPIIDMSINDNDEYEAPIKQQGVNHSMHATISSNRLLSSRFPRQASDDSDTSTNGDSDSNSSDDAASSSSSSGQPQRMLSPTILMFITPSEAIDLVTRLRNDLAEVSKYYSLIVATREDISPALRTIFHRGGSRLCSGKAFYTISPISDDISEFSRYFRDTVQMEGESSDHPLITEYSRHQSLSKMSSELDDIGTEPVIKAVWTAASAFKMVHRKECGNQNAVTSSASGANQLINSSSSGGRSSASDSSEKHSRQSNGRSGARSASGGGGGGGAATSDCMVKMNKNMSYLVQKSLKRLDVVVNSTGLQALDGFRIKFDESNELLTNKFSIKYINKECEIVEIGQYSGLKAATLELDEESLSKSFESALPDPWPIHNHPTASTASNSDNSMMTLLTTSSGGGGGGAESTSRPASGSTSANQDDAGSSGESTPSTAATTSGQQDDSSASSSPSDESDGDSGSSSSDTDSNNKHPSGSFEITQASEPPKKQSAIASTLGSHQARSQQAMSRRQHKDQAAGQRQRKQALAAPETATDDDDTTSTVTSIEPTMSIKQQDLIGTINREHANMQALPKLMHATTTLPSVSPETTTTTVTPTITRPMRKLKPFPTGTPTTVRDWLPRASNLQQNLGDDHLASDHLAEIDNQSTQQHNLEVVHQLNASSSTTRAPIYSTLPESGGNTDLDMPAFKSSSRTAQPTMATTATTSTTTTSLRPTATMTTIQLPPSITSDSKQHANQRTLDTSASASAVASAESIDYVTLSPALTSTQQYLLSPINANQTNQRLRQEMNYLDVSPIPLITSHSPPAISNRPIMHNNNNVDDNDDNNETGSLKLSMPTVASGQTMPASHSSVRSSNMPGSASANNINPSASHNQNHNSHYRSKFRSHFKWIYSSWIALTILGANICGALFTLYVLTFLLMKNFDGTLDRESQGIRSMHLLSIIVVFFGSTLFIVYPTPGLCLLRTSWHNFALVLLFGSLLLQTMQIRSINSLGLGGRPNRLNQFLTLVFMVGVQVSFELQRWRYESPNYVNFVNQYFGSSENGDNKLMLFSSSLAGQFNPLAGHSLDNPQIGPISLKISEKYQSLLQDYCSLSADSFLQSQVYLWIIISILVLFGIITKRQNIPSLTAAKAVSNGVTRSLHQQIMSSSSKHHPRLSATLMNGNKLDNINRLSQQGMNNISNSNIISNHNNSYDISGPSQYQFSPNIVATSAIVGHNHHSNGTSIGNVFVVTLISAPIYFISVVLHVHGQHIMSQDLVSSITMVLLAFTTLLGIFLPIIHHAQHRFDGLLLDHHSSASSSPLSAGVQHIDLQHHPQNHPGDGGILISNGYATNPNPQSKNRGKKKKKQPRPSTDNFGSGCDAFAMFPEFAPNGLRRPASLSGESSSGSRRPFAETRESRKNMSVALANLGPSIGSLRNLGIGQHHRKQLQQQQHRYHQNQQQQQLTDDQMPDNHLIDPALLNLKLNLASDDEMAPMVDNDLYNNSNSNNHNNNTNNHQSIARERPSSSGEKRLIMLDVDPCCPRHGHNAPTAASGSDSTLVKHMHHQLHQDLSHQQSQPQHTTSSSHLHSHHHHL